MPTIVHFEILADDIERSKKFYTDHFTSKSLVSHSTAVSKEELVEIDMLPR